MLWLLCDSLLVVTQTNSTSTNLNQLIGLGSTKLSNRKVWTKPEIRELNFSATASGGGPNADANGMS